MKPRQIDLVGQDIRPIEPSFDNEDQLSFYIETWFDVDKYFGEETEDTDNWINFYAIYHRSTDTITTEYTLDTPDEPIYKDWELTREEELYIRQKLDEYCMNDINLPLKEYFDELVNK